MKKHFVLLISGAMVFTLFSSLKSENRNDQPEKKAVRHIKMITVKDGVRHEVDTLITGDDVKIFHSDGKGKFHWMALDSSSSDSSVRHLTLRHSGERKPMALVGKPGKAHRRLMVAPLAPGLPAPSRLPFVQAMRHRQGNVIDLSDQGILSFKKKKLSGDREKITIIRKRVAKDEKEFIDVITDTRGDELEKMNAPKPFPEFKMKERTPGEKRDKKVEIEIREEK